MIYKHQEKQTPSELKKIWIDSLNLDKKSKFPLWQHYLQPNLPASPPLAALLSVQNISSASCTETHPIPSLSYTGEPVNQQTVSSLLYVNGLLWPSSWKPCVLDTIAAVSFSSYCIWTTSIDFIIVVFPLFDLKARGSIENLKLHWGSTS